MSVWKILECSSRDLQLVYTLGGGQSFRWQKNEANEWTGVFSQRVWSLKQTDAHILFKVSPASDVDTKAKGEIIKVQKRRGAKSKTSHTPLASSLLKADNEEDKRLLHEYFRLDFPLEEMYKHWSDRDPNFKKVSSNFYGVRMLKQDPAENIFSFICSSNNHISRISSMVEKLCSLYGPLLANIDGKAYYGFPAVESLADSSVEQVLREQGFGYRAKFIQRSAAAIEAQGGLSWLKSLQSKSYEEAKSSLMTLPGIGAKVADCICLMSLGHLQAIPVDTHVWQISCQYLPHLTAYKSVTDKVYNEIGTYFRNLFGESAGWAHTVLFCADLKMFQDKSIKKAKKRKASSS